MTLASNPPACIQILRCNRVVLIGRITLVPYGGFMTRARARDMMDELGLNGKEDDGPSCGNAREAGYYHSDDDVDAKAEIPNYGRQTHYGAE